MVLVDFYQLAVLHKLSHGDAGDLFDCPDPPTMPAATQSSSRLPAVETDQPRSIFPLPPPPVPRTPKRKHSAIQSTPNLTPTTRGTSVLQRLRHAAEETKKYDSSKYEEYIVQDFERHRVFVDIDVFMKHVLHVPDNWKDLWGETIRQIERDAAFSISYMDYSIQCSTPGAEETRFYKPLVGMTNAILDFSANQSKNESVKPRTPQRYLRNDPRNVHCGVMNDLSPDIIAVHDEFLPKMRLGELGEWHLKKANMTWAQPLQALEVKPSDGALVDGSCMPRLMVNGRDPQQDHAYPPMPSRFPKKEAARATTDVAADNATVSAPPDLPPGKRPAEESSESSRKSQKQHRKSTPGGKDQAEKKPRRPQTNETNRQKDAYLQVGRYLLEQFSVPAFRSHATIGLVDRDRIQFYHANRSVVLVSSALSFAKDDERDGLKKFIAIGIAFGRLSLRDNGILHNLGNGELFKDNEKLPTRRIPPVAVQMQDGNRLILGGGGGAEQFTVILGEVISHEPSLAGRSTAVLQARSSEWNDVELVVKISWPGSGRVAESKFLEAATSEAKSAPDGEWALNHLPRVLYAQDVVFDSDSTHGKVASVFDDAKIINGEYEYEGRTLRIIIQERLYPLKELTNVKDIAQVLLDVACVHRWLYEKVGILHRDLSPNNIMYRVVEGKVYGVLTDYDLASWTSSLTGDYTKTSQQRTGTPPYMAHGLLDGSDPLHLYRHDVESLFYIMLILATHYEIHAPKRGRGGGVRVRKGAPHFQDWFEAPNYNTLGGIKSDFFTKLKDFEVSPSFQDLRGWLLHIQTSFADGFLAKVQHDRRQKKRQQLLMETSEQTGVQPAAFDDETLEGNFTYSTLIQPARNLKGALEGLVVRYDPPSPLPPTSTGAAQADP